METASSMANKLTSSQENRLRSAMSDCIRAIHNIAPDTPITFHISPDDSYCSIEHWRDAETGMVTREPRHLHKIIFHL